MTSTCSIDGCDRSSIAKGLCPSHYNSARLARMRAERRNVDRLCARCSESIAGMSPAAIYCSDACKESAYAERKRRDVLERRTGRTCRQCGGPIAVTSSTKAITCSRKCSLAYQNRLRAERAAARREQPPCVECGSPIDKGVRLRKFCSPQCKSNAHGRIWRATKPHYMRMHLYGVSQQQYEAMLAEQGGLCAVCRTDEWGGRHGVPHVDHDHSTGAVRGLLCDNCNQGLGRFGDDPTRLRAAAEYLERSTT